MPLRINDKQERLSGLFLFLIVLQIILFSFLLFFSLSAQAIDVKTYVPVNAKPLMPVLKEEIDIFFPSFKWPEYFPGLIEQESCVHLKHSRCFKPNSTLSTSRELGIGIGQLTKAYKADGSIRFDSLTDLRKLHMAELRELSWENVATRPDLQIRAILLMTKDNYSALYQVKCPYERLKMADAAYNGGLGGLKKERLKCSLTKGCDPQYWDNNVEKIVLKSTKPIYGTSSPYSINREHVYNVFNLRKDKYKPYFK